MSACYAYGHPDFDMNLMSATGDTIRERPIHGSSTSMRSGSPFEELGRALIACTDAVDEQTLKHQILTRNWLGLGLDGIIVLRNLATCHSIRQAQGKILSLMPGHIVYEGQPRDLIKMDFDKDVPCKPITSPLHDVKSEDVVPSLRSRFLFRGYKDTLWLRHEIFIDSDLLTVAQPVDVSTAITRLIVTEPCKHLYTSTLDDLKGLHRGKNAPSLHPGFTLNIEGGRPAQEINGTAGIHIYYQQVNRNDLGQWLVCQWSRNFGSSLVLVLQTGMCLECTIHGMLNNEEELLHMNIFNGHFCIIAGGADNEYSRSPLPRIKQHPGKEKGTSPQTILGDQQVTSSQHTPPK
ncbi:hypothetical protein MMC28_001410 [Mycoblastus sanguinarius]|nr:hypothetical protein [Mycoblastus sanguinarius]